MRRSVAQQAVSPLASPMESRRVFMATHHQNNPSGGGGGGGSPPPTQLSGGQIMGAAPHPATAVGLSAVQLGLVFFKVFSFVVGFSVWNFCNLLLFRVHSPNLFWFFFVFPKD